MSRCWKHAVDKPIRKHCNETGAMNKLLDYRTNFKNIISYRNHQILYSVKVSEWDIKVNLTSVRKWRLQSCEPLKDTSIAWAPGCSEWLMYAANSENKWQFLVLIIWHGSIYAKVGITLTTMEMLLMKNAGFFLSISTVY